MNFHGSKIIHAEGEIYEDYSSIHVTDLNNLKEYEVGDLINTSLGNLPTKNYSKNSNITKILNLHGFYTEDQIKEKKGIKFSEKDKFYLSDYDNGFCELDEYRITTFSLDRLKQILESDKVFVAINIPTEAKNKILELIKQKQEKVKKSAARKELKKVEKAKKILQESGITIND